jgi:lysozyme family protein
MSDIEAMVENILAHEGGFVNDPDDPGGATNYGITLRTYSQWLGRPASVAEVHAMTIDTAKEIYLANYYYGPRINGFPEPIQPQVFDCAVNHGPRRAIKFVQTVCNLAGFGPLVVDGVNGPVTMDAAAKAYNEMQGYFINAIADERIDFYHRIVKSNPSQKKFLQGWLARANDYKVETEETV